MAVVSDGCAPRGAAARVLATNNVRYRAPRDLDRVIAMAPPVAPAVPLAPMTIHRIISRVTHSTQASAALRRAHEFPSLSLAELPSPVEELKRLRSVLRSG